MIWKSLAVTIVLLMPPVGESQPSIAVYFSPNGGCTDAVVREVDAAKRSIRIQAYTFTSTRIAKAVMNAVKRGVTVQACLDKVNNTDRFSSATFLENQGVE